MTSKLNKEQNKAFKQRLKEICAICGHSWGMHLTQRCDDCYKENSNYKRHVFKRK